MGSTLLVLRTLLENQLDVGVTSTSTDPTSTLLNSYINNAVRKIARRDKPREYLNATAISGDITSGQNTVTIPSTILVPIEIYYKNSGSAWRKLIPKSHKLMIDYEGVNSFFDSNNQGDPLYWNLRGTSIVFNKYFSRTEVGAIKIFGITPPTTLALDADTVELPTDYDMLIAYESAILYYQKDDDFANQQKYQLLASQEKTELKISLDYNNEQVIEMDSSVFIGNVRGINDPNVFFGT